MVITEVAAAAGDAAARRPARCGGGRADANCGSPERPSIGRATRKRGDRDMGRWAFRGNARRARSVRKVSCFVHRDIKTPAERRQFDSRTFWFRNLRRRAGGVAGPPPPGRPRAPRTRYAGPNTGATPPGLPLGLPDSSEEPRVEPLSPGVGAGCHRHRDPVRGEDVRLLPRRLAQLPSRPRARRGGHPGVPGQPRTVPGEPGLPAPGLGGAVRTRHRPVPGPRLRHPDREQRPRRGARGQPGGAHRVRGRRRGGVRARPGPAGGRARGGVRPRGPARPGRRRWAIRK